MAVPNKARSPKSRNAINAEYVRYLLNYNPRTGHFRWKMQRGGRGKKGAIAGRLSVNGYIVIGIDNVIYYGHRLAWLWMPGTWPKNEIDHVCSKRADNRWHKLREAAHAENTRNVKLKSSGRSGLKGASFHKEKQCWRSHITVNYKFIHLGYFKTKKLAHQAYCKAAKKFHGKFARFK